MKQVWQCDFCTQTASTEAEMSAHEKDCSFNPVKKLCWSCAHRTDEGAPMSGFWNGCSAGVPSEKQMDVEDRERFCDKWALSPDYQLKASS